MKSEIKYLLSIVLIGFVALVGYVLLTKHELAPGPELAARSIELTDGGGKRHLIPASWQGSGHLARLLGADLDSRVRLADAPDRAVAVSYLGGASARADGPVSHRAVVQPQRRGARTQLLWQDGDTGYKLVHADGDDRADLFITRNRVKYLVPLITEQRAAAGAGATAVTTSLDLAREAMSLIAPRFLVLLVLYLVVAGAFYGVCWHLLKGRLARRKVQPGWPKKGRLRAEMGHSLIVLFAMALFSYGSVLVVESGHSKVYKDLATYGWGYWWFSLVVIFLLMDAFTYWTHRLMHHPFFFSRVHAIHHRSYHPSPWTTLSMSVNEIIINAVFMPAVLMLMPVHQHIAIVFTLLTLLKNVFNHLGFELFPRWVNGWLVGATFHETHHMSVNGNYSSYFTWWDRWMKTEHRDYARNLERVSSSATVAS